MKILVVSDIHYELGAHHGVDESGAYEWLLKTVRRTKSESLIGLGDWGNAWTMSQWFELTKHIKVFAIYGNHDNIPLLKGIVNADSKKALMEDGGIRVIKGIRFGFINGIVSETKRMKEGVPRKTGKEYLRAGSLLSGVDVLCTHESPFVPEYGGRLHSSPGTEAVGTIIELVKPKLALSGHLSGPYTLSQIGGTVCLRVDSSPSEKHSAILKLPDWVLEVHNDRGLVLEKTLGSGRIRANIC